MNLRCTAKLLKFLRERPHSDPPDTNGQDWYANLLWIDRRKCLLLIHELTLFPIFAPDIRKADLTPIEPFLVGQIAQALRAERLPPRTFGELETLEVTLAKTRSRSVLGSMNDMALTCWNWTQSAGGIGDLDIDKLNHQLRRTPMGALDGAYSLDKAQELAWGPSLESTQQT